LKLIDQQRAVTNVAIEEEICLSRAATRLGWHSGSILLESRIWHRLA